MLYIMTRHHAYIVESVHPRCKKNFIDVTHWLHPAFMYSTTQRRMFIIHHTACFFNTFQFYYTPVFLIFTLPVSIPSLRYPFSSAIYLMIKLHFFRPIFFLTVAFSAFHWFFLLPILVSLTLIFPSAYSRLPYTDFSFCLFSSPLNWFFFLSILVLPYTDFSLCLFSSFLFHISWILFSSRSSLFIPFRVLLIPSFSCPLFLFIFHSFFLLFPFFSPHFLSCFYFQQKLPLPPANPPLH